MNSISIIPQPTQIQYHSGTFTLSPETVIVTSEQLRPVGAYLAERLSQATGWHFDTGAPESAPSGKPSILLQLDAGTRDGGTEGYKLLVQEHGIRILASTPAGAFYGCQTLLQLFPPEIEEPQPISGIEWTIPQLDITDSPRFPWRGMHLDVGRHFMPREFVKKYIDLIARYKMNTFHWHLTEDQGWRIEIKKYPKLTEVGAWRMENVGLYGGYYTQDDVREIVEYAQSRHITVVPEIEMPGHSMAALAAYPELSCTGGPFEVRAKWGIAEDVYCAGNEQVFEFLENVLMEVFELFPDPYVHVGGDECPKVRWKTCPKCQERIRAEGLQDKHELQSYVIKRMERFLSAHDKRLIGWDEILEGGLAPGATVMSWRGMKGGITAAQAGHDVIMVPTSHCYFDYPQTRDPGHTPPEYHWYLPLETVYDFEPVPPDIEPDKIQHILGSQGNVWTEFMETPEHVEKMVLPRMCALAEVVWSEKEQRNWHDFQTRLLSQYARFDALNLKYHRY
jgi:hexosaminidase